MNKQNTLGLVAPKIPVAEPDGLIKINDLNEDVIITFPLWYGVTSLDTNQLLINSIPIGKPVPIGIPEPDEETQVTLSIPIATQLQEDGLFSIQYRATNTENGATADSAVTTIRIDRTAPGAALLASALFAGINFGETLNGTVPGYAGMAAGDTVQMLCNGVEGPAYTVQPEHLTTSPLEVSLPRTFLEGLASQKVIITYQVTDRAGNKSLLAQPIELTMQR